MCHACLIEAAYGTQGSSACVTSDGYMQVSTCQVLYHDAAGVITKEQGEQVHGRGSACTPYCGCANPDRLCAGRPAGDCLCCTYCF